MFKILYSLFFIIAISNIGCNTNQSKKTDTWKTEILNTEKQFSNASKTKGMKQAFIEHMDDDGILLRPNQTPIIGANAIEFLTEINDSAFTLTWLPSSAQVSASGDLGYSYGIYNLQLQDTILRGTYVNIWKKQSDGKWKFVLDSGNEGTGISK